jgi:hypothetical protein
MIPFVVSRRRARLIWHPNRRNLTSGECEQLIGELGTNSRGLTIIRVNVGSTAGWNLNSSLCGVERFQVRWEDAGQDGVED